MSRPMGALWPFDMMKITVKRDRCCGAQRCIQFAPDVYRLDALGYNCSDGDTVPPAMEDDAKRGAMACPEDAIHLEITAARA
jgi:ferredoxin